MNSDKYVASLLERIETLKGSVEEWKLDAHLARSDRDSARLKLDVAERERAAGRELLMRAQKQLTPHLHADDTPLLVDIAAALEMYANDADAARESRWQEYGADRT